MTTLMNWHITSRRLGTTRRDLSFERTVFWATLGLCALAALAG